MIVVIKVKWFWYEKIIDDVFKLPIKLSGFGYPGAWRGYGAFL